MKWNIFHTKLKLSENQARKTRKLLDNLKYQITELYLMPNERGITPLDFVVELKMENPHMDQALFSRRFLNFLSQENGPVLDETYLEISSQLEASAQAEFLALLQDEQKRIYQFLILESLQQIDTGYDPFNVKLTEKIVQNQKLDFEQRLSPTFCILPWIHLLIDNNGFVKLCCYTKELLKEKDRTPLSINNHPLIEIWNGEKIKKIRRKMLAGEKVAACLSCELETEMGQTSRRAFYNLGWLHYGQEKDKWWHRIQNSKKNNYSVNEGPIYLTLLPGNSCNLKCRMCSSIYSSAISNDVVHHNWDWFDFAEKVTNDEKLKWFESDNVMTKLLEHIPELRMFHLIGGEPLLNTGIKKLINTLAESNVSQNINLELSTNLTIFNNKFFDTLTNFKSVLLMISLDGIGPSFEYIRYPGRWTEVENNLRKLKRYSKLTCRITATIQNYNVLSITDLLQFAESFNLPTTLNILHIPDYLNIRVMPERARLLAAKRLREYAANSTIVQQDIGMASTINNVIVELEHNSEEYYHKYMPKFMSFTNDLDRSRNQSFKVTFPELFNFVVQDGFKWTDEVLHSV
ncbi:twitch domain-containing radical SAM protein [candidate division CSSED10-310 bacterium]|uniref:Twitch domain-containing radical SAM protein n=1 Tax=candidate division CSSED10-310 bacterium TaxID=2855610 RepID=A0ABV6YSX9_UNCC1